MRLTRAAVALALAGALLLTPLPARAHGIRR